MVDKVNPTSQFHPYQPERSGPQADNVSGLGGLLSRFGIDSNTIGSLGGKLRNTDLRGGLAKAQGAARNNPGMVLGGLAALAIGAGLMRKRSLGR